VRAGSGRETDLGRRSAHRAQRRTVLVATNGESTEKTYFSELRHESWVRQRVVVVVEKGSPLSVVKGAARRRDRDDYDEAWAVCDVDEFPTQEASSQANTDGVRMAWSNPCFELWLLLHKDTHGGFIADAKAAEKLMRQCVQGWKKSNLDFAAFRDSIEDAVHRAKSLGTPPHENPSTAVWQLIEALK
jgi:hypothetical protein